MITVNPQIPGSEGPPARAWLTAKEGRRRRAAEVAAVSASPGPEHPRARDLGVDGRPGPSSSPLAHHTLPGMRPGSACDRPALLPAAASPDRLWVGTQRRRTVSTP